VNAPFELKFDGTHGIVRCTNSSRHYEDKDGNFIHNGQRLSIIAEGTLIPEANNAYVEGYI
jgi:hypothetical protein